jgi:hypothetical protein
LGRPSELAVSAQLFGHVADVQGPVNLGSLGDWYSGASGLNDRDQTVGIT